MQMRIFMISAALIANITISSSVLAQGHRFRDHDEIQSKPLALEDAVVNPGTTQVKITANGSFIHITGNGIPGHAVGRFPNNGNPNAIRSQNINLRLPRAPQKASQISPLELGWNFGVSLHGVVFDPLAAEFWAGNPRSGWSYNALGGALPLGLDTNHAHVQPTGTYHYHGIPTGFIELLGWRSDTHSPLVGYAADGYPIYALSGAPKGKVTTMRSSYRLKSGERPAGQEPGGTYDGTFNEDYKFVKSHGNLDQCNGSFTLSTEYPNGTYAYFLTEDYPVVPRCFMGTPDESFRFGRRR